MTAANRNRGAVTERMVVTWLRAHGWPDAERRLVTGHRTRSRTRPDHGDVTGTPICWQVKSLRPVNAAERRVPAWMAETEAQRQASGADIGVLVVRRDGTSDVGEWWAWLRLDAVAHLIDTPWCVPSSAPMRLTVADAVTLLHDAGYGDPPDETEATL